MVSPTENMPIEIVVPLPLQKTAARLKAQHESATFWAWKGQRRTVVNIRIIDNNAVAYTIKRVPKSWMAFETSLAYVKGTMHRLDDHSTLVIGKPEMSLFWTIGLGLMFAVMMVIGAFVSQSDSTTDAASALWFIVLPFILLPIILGGVWWDIRKLKNLINNTLNNVPPLYGSRTSYDSFR